MNITSAKYNLTNDGHKTSIQAVIDGKELSIPMSQGNRHYAEIMRQVEAGELTIASADAQADTI